MVPYGIPSPKRFLLYSAALFSNCKLRKPEADDYLSAVTTNSKQLVLSFYGFRELERKMMIRKIWKLLWFQNSNDLKKK